MVTSSKLKKKKKGGSGHESGPTDLPPPFVSLDYCSSIKTEGREGEMKFYTPHSGLIAAAFPTIAPKAIAGSKGC